MLRERRSHSWLTLHGLMLSCIRCGSPAGAAAASFEIAQFPCSVCLRGLHCAPATSSGPAPARPLLPQAQGQLLAQAAAAEHAHKEARAREDERARIHIILENERAAVAARSQAAETAATELQQELSKRKRLQDENKVCRAAVQRIVAAVCCV